MKTAPPRAKLVPAFRARVEQDQMGLPPSSGGHSAAWGRANPERARARALRRTQWLRWCNRNDPARRKNALLCSHADPNACYIRFEKAMAKEAALAEIPIVPRAGARVSRTPRPLRTMNRGEGSPTPTARKSPKGNPGSKAEWAIHVLLTAWGWEQDWADKKKHVGYDVRAQKGDVVIYIEVKSGGGMVLTDKERQAAEKYADAYLLVHVLGGHQKWWQDPTNNSGLRFTTTVTHQVSGWRASGSFNPPSVLQGRSV